MLPMHTNSTATLAPSAGPAAPWLTGEVDILRMVPAATVTEPVPIVPRHRDRRLHAAFTPSRHPGSGAPVLRSGRSRTAGPGGRAARAANSPRALHFQNVLGPTVRTP